MQRPQRALLTGWLSTRGCVSISLQLHENPEEVGSIPVKEWTCSKGEGKQAESKSFLIPHPYVWVLAESVT